MKHHDTSVSDDEIDYKKQFRMFPVQLLILDHHLRVADASEVFCRNTATTHAELIGRNIFEVLPSPDELRLPIEDALRRALDGEETTVEELYYPLPDPEGGPDAIRDLWWTATNRPLRNAAGDITHVVQVAEPVTEKVKAQQLSAAVLEELEHRIGNMMTLTLSIAKRTARSEPDLDAFMTSFQERIVALASTHRMLTGKNWRGLTLDALLKKHLEPYMSESDMRAIALSGPALHLTSQYVEAISMAVHELVTNAAKYGALSAAGGRLDVRWGGAPGEDFWLEWRESDLGKLAPPTREGFGTQILSVIFPQQMSATAERTFEEHQFTYALRPKAG